MVHWTQVYDPFGRWWLSTLVATLPILVLFGLLVGLKVKPHWCAISGATTAATRRRHIFQDAGGLGGREFWLRRRFWFAEDCLDRAGRSFSLRHFCRDRPVRNHEGIGCRNHRRPPPAGVAGGVLLRRFHRRRSRIRRTRRHRGRFDDRAWLPAVSCGGAESDRQHRAGGLGQHRDSHPHSGSRLRSAGIGPERDHRTHPALHCGDRAVLAGPHHGELERDL